jgi:hypothetical protein
MTAVLDEASASTHQAHLMHELNHEGDAQVAWDTDNREEVDVARDTFNRLKKKGYLAYRADTRGRQTGSQLREFDPEAERIVLVKPLVGG